jgi:hypothetical protein
MMNCRKAEQLIPLFVETDLDAAEMQQVTAHVETCPSCRGLVAEFQASQTFLRAVALPAFDEAMLTEMRSVVMQSVGQPATRPAFVEWLQPIWTWKFAVAAAVILLVAGVAISRYGAKTIDNQVAGKPKEAKSASAAVGEKIEAKLPPAAQQPQPRMGRKKIPQGGVSASERNPGNDATKQPSPVRATDVDNQIAAAPIAPSANIIRADSFTLPPANVTTNVEKSAPEPEMLRMEFQTADPNIRIIWLTPKEPTRTTPATDTK